MTELISRAEELLKDVSPGPWDYLNGAWENIYHISDEFYYLIVRNGVIREADAKFISASRELVPQLLSELKSTQDQLQRIKECR